MKQALYSVLVTPLLVLAPACSAGDTDGEMVARSSEALASGALDATLTINSDWGSGYCAEIRLINNGTAPIQGWVLRMDVKQSTISSSWNGVFTSVGGTQYQVTSLPEDPVLWGSSWRSLGFCANSAQGGAAYRPILTSLSCEGGTCGSAGGTGGSAGTGGSGGTGGGGKGGGGTGGSAAAPFKVFGQPTLGDTVPNQIAANRGFHTQGVAIQRNGTNLPDRVFVVDSGNQRILGFRSLGTCSNQATRECTNNGECTSGGTCVITGQRNADIAIGQANLLTGTCNGDNTKSLAPTASTLCLLPYPKAISLLEHPSPLSLAVDAAGALYVPDMWNHRVLKYNDPLGTDRVADTVWGQPNFTSRACNQGLAQPSRSTLCLSSENPDIHISGDQLGTGVEVSPDGKVWVADQGNGRVVRFPSNSNQADLVLGQADFNTGSRDPSECTVGGPNTGRRMCFPKAVRYDAASNRVYVLEWRGGSVLDWTNADYRILIYQAPFTNGMAATEIITGTSFDVFADPPETECWTTGSLLCLRRPLSLELVPNTPNAFWLADSGMSRVLYIDKSTGSWKPRKVLSQPNLTQVGDVGVNCASPNNDDCLASQPGGGLGIDSAGNVYVAEDGNYRVMRYPGNIADAPVTGGTAVAANAVLFPMNPGHFGATNANRLSGAGFTAPHVVRLVNYPGGAKQMIVRDAFRVVFWNNYDQASVLNGATANGALYQPNLTTNLPNSQASDHIADIDFDAQGRVYVAVRDRVDVFQGPLTNNQQPLASVTLSDVPFALGQGFPSNVHIAGIAYQASTQALFVADTGGHRLLRVSQPFSASPVIDWVLGQRGPNGYRPNRDRDFDPATGIGYWNDCLSVQPDGFAGLGEMRFDRLGNLYVTDTTHEGWQCSNNRILEFDASTLVPDTSRPFFCGTLDAQYDDTPAELADPSRQTCGTPRRPRRVYGPENFTTPEPRTRRPGHPTFPFAVAFDAQNRMILSADAYGNVANERVYYYANPTPTCTQQSGCFVAPRAIFPGIHAQPASVSFDASGNMAVLDHTWNRVLLYRGSDVAAWMAAN